MTVDLNELEAVLAKATPQIGPEHIEALAEAIEEAEATIAREITGFGVGEAAAWLADIHSKAAQQRAARLAEIRAYLENSDD